MQFMLRITLVLAIASITFVSGCSKSGSEASEGMDSILGAVTSNPQLSTLAGLVGSAGLGSVLSGKNPLTMLAPSNDAFAKLGPTALDELKKPENMSKLTNVLQSHIIPGKLEYRRPAGKGHLRADEYGRRPCADGREDRRWQGDHRRR